MVEGSKAPIGVGNGHIGQEKCVLVGEREQVTKNKQVKQGTKKVWVKLPSGLFGWRKQKVAMRRTEQLGASSTGADFKWVPAQLGGVNSNSNLAENGKPGISKTNKRKQLTMGLSLSWGDESESGNGETNQDGKRLRRRVALD